MGKIITLTLILLLSGCGVAEPRVITKPILVCPSNAEFNNGQPINKHPDLEIYKLTPNSSPGETARAYEITVKQLQSHADEMYTVLDSYDKTSAKYKELQKAIDIAYPQGHPSGVCHWWKRCIK